MVLGVASATPCYEPFLGTVLLPFHPLHYVIASYCSVLGSLIILAIYVILLLLIVSDLRWSGAASVSATSNLYTLVAFLGCVCFGVLHSLDHATQDVYVNTNSMGSIVLL
jgi:hypothetical protein